MKGTQKSIMDMASYVCDHICPMPKKCLIRKNWKHTATVNVT